MNTHKTLSAGILSASLACLAAMALAHPQTVAAGHGKLFDQTGCACCPVCDHVCKLDAKESETERTCFEIETKAICIPRVVFPWQKSKLAGCASCDSCSGRGCTACVHNGARVRKVLVAKPKTYTCPSCEYKWTAEKTGACCGTCNGGCCAGGPACDGGCICDEVSTVMPPVIEPVSAIDVGPVATPMTNVPAAATPAAATPAATDVAPTVTPTAVAAPKSFFQLLTSGRGTDEPDLASPLGD